MHLGAAAAARGVRWQTAAALTGTPFISGPGPAATAAARRAGAWPPPHLGLLISGMGFCTATLVERDRAIRVPTRTLLARPR